LEAFAVALEGAGGREHSLSFNSGRRGHTPYVFQKSAQVVRFHDVANIQKTGVCNRLILLGLAEGVLRKIAAVLLDWRNFPVTTISNW
jgi:hypothetical protein